MCGIVGAVSESPIDQGIIVSMRERLVHRGPDHGGVWMAENARVCLGHRRLAIIDLSPEANQPFISCDGRFVITFNGEIYNFHSLRQELVADGVLFRTLSDTEVLVEAYRRWGHQCLDRLVGMFAFAIWDTREQRLFCARDRMGEKPFYYARLGGSFIFASELKALLLWPNFRKEIHYPAVVDYLSFGYVVDPKSIWEDCYKLPPGHWMSVEVNQEGMLVNDPLCYWDMEFDPDDSIADWSPLILGALQKASREMAFADVPVGTFLSGGVDSSSVTAALSQGGCSVKTFTVGFDEHEYDERPWAREVSQRYGLNHLEKVVSAEDVTSVIHDLLWNYDEPFNDYSYLPTFYLCREARRDITVALSGDGGDELFAGYGKYQRLGRRQDVERRISWPLGRVVFNGTKRLFPKTSRIRERLSAYGMDAPSMMLDMLTTGFALPALRKAARGPLAEALRHYSPMDTIVPLLRKAPPRELGLVNSMRYLDLKLTLAGDILVKVDRASMAVSLEVRPVYLHRDVVALAGRIPSGLLADRNESKRVLKTALRSWLPESLLYRPKQGFAMPLKKWINGGLDHLFAEQHGENGFDDLLDSSLLREMIRRHTSGNADLTSQIHSLFFFDNWLAKWS